MAKQLANVGTTPNDNTGDPLRTGYIKYNADMVEIYNQFETANGIAQTSYAQANTAGNTVATYANGTIVLANGNLNFNNTATVNVFITANGSTQTNIAFVANVPLSGGANLVSVYANGTLVVGNANVNRSEERR